MADNELELWMGRSSTDRPLRYRLTVAIKRSGGQHPRPGYSLRRFTGARIGRGAGVGRLLATYPVWSQRRVIIKASIVKLAGKSLAGPAQHLRYLLRDGTTREGERGVLYGADHEAIDGKPFLQCGADDRHQFRLIVAPEDGAQYDDLKPLIRRWMAQAEEDLGSRLDWVAVDHFNTGHPHSHLILRGKDDRGDDLIIAPEYLTCGLAARASQLVDLDLGPRTHAEVLRALRHEIDQERLTSIDRRLVASIDPHGLVHPAASDNVEQALRAGRLQSLARLGLAVPNIRGAWRLDDDLERILERMGERHSIVRIMKVALSQQVPERLASDFAIHDLGSLAATGPITGRVVSCGLCDEHADRHYLIVDGVDGRGHYIDIGVDAPPTAVQSIVRVRVAADAPTTVDQTIVEIAEANGGRYSVDLHLRHAPSANQALARLHHRRLEALHRAGSGPQRLDDGSWVIGPDYSTVAARYAQDRARRRPVIIETLSVQTLVDQRHYNGITWLDREALAEQPTVLGRGFGCDVRKALGERRQWLVAHNLAALDGETIRYRTDLLALLEQRALNTVTAQLSVELGLPLAEPFAASRIEGIYRGAVHVGEKKYALIQNSREFSLLPWSAALERASRTRRAGLGEARATVGRLSALEVGVP